MSKDQKLRVEVMNDNRRALVGQILIKCNTIPMEEKCYLLSGHFVIHFILIELRFLAEDIIR